jgi:bilin biosynthesis protein
VRFEAVSALGRLNDTRAIEPLIKTLRNGDDKIRTEAEKSLAVIGRPSVAALIRVLTENDSVVQRAAAAVLGDIGDNRAEKPLIQVFKVGDRNVRHEAVTALVKINRTYAVDSFIQFLKDEKERDIRNDTAWALVYSFQNEQTMKQDAARLSN